MVAAGIPCTGVAARGMVSLDASLYHCAEIAQGIALLFIGARVHTRTDGAKLACGLTDINTPFQHRCRFNTMLQSYYVTLGTT